MNSQALMQDYAKEVVRLREALELIERLTREGSRDGHLIRDSAHEVAAKALGLPVLVWSDTRAA